jgi:hypothetical protein
MHRRGIEGLRQRFAEEGFETVLEGKPRGHGPVFSPGKTGRGLPPWYAGRRRRAVPAGPCNYWRTSGQPLNIPIPRWYPGKPSGRH